MNEGCDERLAQTLRSLGYSSLFIRPPWYRSYRLIGLSLPLPVRMGLAEHLLYGGVFAATLFAIAFGAAWGLGYVARVPVATILLPAVVVPLINWPRYRRARRRMDC